MFCVRTPQGTLVRYCSLSCFLNGLFQDDVCYSIDGNWVYVALNGSLGAVLPVVGSQVMNLPSAAAFPIPLKCVQFAPRPFLRALSSFRAAAAQLQL